MREAEGGRFGARTEGGTCVKGEEERPGRSEDGGRCVREGKGGRSGGRTEEVRGVPRTEGGRCVCEGEGGREIVYRSLEVQTKRTTSFNDSCLVKCLLC